MPKPIALTGKESDFSGVVLKAAAGGDLDGLKTLLKHNKAWLRQVGPHGRTMLWEAAYKGHLDVVEYLIRRGAQLDQPACYYTPMLAEVNPRTAALLMDHTIVADALARAGASLDFHDACYLGDQSIVKDGMKKDPAIVSEKKPRSSDPSAATPIFYAVAGVQPRVVQALLAARPQQARDGLLLRWAAWRRDLDIIDQLLACGADPGQSGINDWALDPKLKQLATRHGHAVDINAPNWMGFPALVDACRGNHNQPDDPDRVRQLLDAGAAINVRDSKGKTALHRAAQAGFTRIPRLLLQRGADVNSRDSDGETPIFEAVRAGRPATVMILAQAGADLSLENHRGKTLSDLAARLRGQQRDPILDCIGRSAG